MRGRMLAAVVAGALVLGGAACSDDGDDSDATTDTTEAAEAETTEVGDTGATEAETTEAETTTTLGELDNSVIQETVTDEHPEEAALVDWSIFQWVLGGGYTASVPEGTTPDEAVAVCEAIAEVLDAYDDVDPLSVAAGSASGTPLAGRESPDADCTAAA